MLQRAQTTPATFRSWWLSSWKHQQGGMKAQKCSPCSLCCSFLLAAQIRWYGWPEAGVEWRECSSSEGVRSPWDLEVWGRMPCHLWLLGLCHPRKVSCLLYMRELPLFVQLIVIYSPVEILTLLGVLKGLWNHLDKTEKRQPGKTNYFKDFVIIWSDIICC